MDGAGLLRAGGLAPAGSLGGRLRHALRRPSAAWLAVPGVAFLLFFFGYPVLQLLAGSLQDPDSGDFSLAAYQRMVHAGVYLEVLQTTFVIAAETTAFCLVLGYPLAYWLARMRPSRRDKLILLVMLPFWTSALVKSFGWLVLLARRGIVANTMRTVFGQAPDLLHGRGAVLMAMTHALLPLAILTMLPVMVKIDRTLARAGAMLGAAPAQIFWRIYFPLSTPGVTAACLLVFISSLGFFIVPQLLGGRHETMIAQVILEQIQQALNWQFGGALAALLVVTTLVTSLVFDRVFGVSPGRTDRGAASAPGQVGPAVLRVIGDAAALLSTGSARLLRGGWLLPTYAVVLIFILMVPTLMVVPMSFTNSRFLDFPPTGFSLHWMEVYFGSPVWMAATIRSFVVAIATALLTTVLAGAAALGTVRSSGPLARSVFTLFLGPMVVPPIVTAIALFYLFARLGLIATEIGLVIGHTVMALPLAFIALVAVLRSHDWKLDQAGASLGAGRFTVTRRITLPLVKGGVLAALLFAFIVSFEELTVAIFVTGGLKKTLPRQMWDDILMAVNPTLAAASLVVVTVVVSLFLLAERLKS